MTSISKLVCLIAGAALVAWLAAGPSRDGGAARPSPVVAAGPAAAAVRAAPGQPAPTADADVWTVLVDQRLTLGADESQAALASGTLAIAPLAIAGDEEVQAWTWRPDDDVGALATAELTAPFYVVADRRGTPQAIAFAPATSTAARRAAKLLVSLGQATRPDGRAGSYRALETDATGVYDAEYVATADGWRRQRRDYVRFHGAARALTVGGATALAWRADGALASLVTDETVEASLGASLPTVRSALRVELTWQRRERIALASLSDGLARAEREGLAPGRDAVESAARRDRGIVGERDLATLRADLAAALAAPASDERERAIQLALYRLGALVRLEPGRAAELAAQARAAASLEESGALTASLGAASSEPAVDALAALLDGDGPGELQVQAAAALALATRATDASLAALRRAADGPDRDVGDAALLALGAAGRHAPAVVDELIARYWAADDEAGRRAALEALANAGDPRSLPVLDHALAAGGDLSLAATFGLRFVAGADADHRLGQLVAHADAAHRLAAVQALGFRPLAPWLPVLDARLAVERDPDVQAALARLRARAAREA